MFSSSIPANVPSSDSTDTLNLCAYSVTRLVISMLVLNGCLLASIITDENPKSIACLHASNVDPWSKCRAIFSSAEIFEPDINAINISSPMYFNADSDTAKITGLCFVRTASKIAVNVSIL